MSNTRPYGTETTGSKDPISDQIINTAVRLAEQSSWESVRLYQVAREMEIDLREIHEHFSQKDDLVDAWFDRADRVMLEDAGLADYQLLTTRERIHRSIMSWLNSMQSHREVSRQMLVYKFELGHVHLQVLGLLRISRTVQWILESAHRDSIHVRRVVEEVTLTSIYLATFAQWMFDNSENSENTTRQLDRSLRRAEAIALLTANTKAKRSNPERVGSKEMHNSPKSGFQGSSLH